MAPVLDDEHLAARAGRCRCRSAETARITFGGKVLDCELVQISPEGAQVCLRSLSDVPGGLVALRLPGGETRTMRCVWQNGWHVGLLTAGSDGAAF